MKHTHFDIEANGFYGAYWECKRGADCAIIAMPGDASERFCLAGLYAGKKGRLQGMADRGRIVVFIPLCRKYGRGLQAKRKIYGPKAIAFGPILFKNILQFQFRFDCV